MSLLVYDKDGHREKSSITSPFPPSGCFFVVVVDVERIRQVKLTSGPFNKDFV